MSEEKSRDNSDPKKRVSQWEALMRKFSESHKEECKAISVEIPRVLRSVKQFPTGSQYEGTWDMLGMSGYGVYTFSNGVCERLVKKLVKEKEADVFGSKSSRPEKKGKKNGKGVIYEGEFDDGMFHGKGELRYPSGAILRGNWKRGQLMEKTLIFADGLEYKETDWEYCKMPDRRFTIEYDNGIQPAGRSYLTADQPTRSVPPGYYDTGDGFYDPKTKVVYSAEDITAIIRSPSVREQKWIIDNCRTSPDVPLGPRVDIYEKWSEPQVQPNGPDNSTANVTLTHSQDLNPDSKTSSRWNHQTLLEYKPSIYIP